MLSSHALVVYIEEPGLQSGSWKSWYLRLRRWKGGATMSKIAMMPAALTGVPQPALPLGREIVTGGGRPSLG